MSYNDRKTMVYLSILKAFTTQCVVNDKLQLHINKLIEVYNLNGTEKDYKRTNNLLTYIFEQINTTELDITKYFVFLLADILAADYSLVVRDKKLILWNELCAFLLSHIEYQNWLQSKSKLKWVEYVEEFIFWLEQLFEINLKSGGKREAIRRYGIAK